MGNRENAADSVGPFEPGVLDPSDGGSARALDSDNPVVEAPKEMIAIHAREQTHKRMKRSTKSSRKKPVKKTAKNLTAKQRAAQAARRRLATGTAPSYEIFVETYKRRLHESEEAASLREEGAPRERGGTSVPCRVCAGPTRVLFTRRSGLDRAGSWQRGPVCPGDIGDIYRRRECKNVHCHAKQFGTIEHIVEGPDPGDEL